MTARFYLLDEKQGGDQTAGLKNVTHRRRSTLS
jgi:hypothetical protein